MFEKLIDNAVIPTRATAKSAGYDIVATSFEWSDSGNQITYRTGIRLKDIPDGFFGALFPRSSIANMDIRLANAVGVIDADYEGEILVKFDCPPVAAVVMSRGNARIYSVGDKIAQLVFLPCTWDDITPVTAMRGEGGFGSTSKKPKKGASNGSEDI